ncbi:MAG: hypothetical protein ACRCXL_10925 [Dermatophilaceae bacterium]
MSAAGTLRAWVDESGSDRARDPGTYILAAAIGRHDAEPTTRHQMSQLRLPGQIKLHWRDESAKRRQAIIRAVANCEIEHLVVVRAGAVDDRPERRRRKCLERLLYELELKYVHDIVLESRGRADDRRDLDLLNALRGGRNISTTIRLTHVIGRSEPMLWIPDAVAGTVTSSRTGEPRHRQVLEEQLTLIEI